MARQIYILIYGLLLPFIFARLWWRGRKNPQYRLRWAERLGVVIRPEVGQPPLWIHAVSVGETVAAAPLLEKLLLSHPDLPVLITTMTPTGSDRVRSLFGNRVTHCYAPYDLPFCVNRFLDRIQPRAVVIMETELWPNWIHCCQQREIPVVLANGRLSAKSAAGYAKFSALIRPMLRSLSWLAVQEDSHAKRFIALGAHENALSVIGNIKFDLQLSADLSQKAGLLREQWGEQRPVLVAGSTHEGEELLLLDTFTKLQRDDDRLLLIIVPRHPERFSAVKDLLNLQSWSFAVWSDSNRSLRNAQVLLVDTMGELLNFYAAADIAIVGGSFINRGGHNPLEPAALAVPVVMGRSVFNFQDICDQLLAVGALELTSYEALGEALAALLADRSRRQSSGAAGRRYIDANRGALNRLYSGLQRYL